jgi:hypothetical protein
MSTYSLRQPAWKKYGADLSMNGHQEQSRCNWSSSQAGQQMLFIWLNRPACEHTGVNAYGGTAVGPKTALCKADYDCPAGLAVNKAMKLASKRFSLENTKEVWSSDRFKAQQGVYLMQQDPKVSHRVNVYFAFLRSGARPRSILPPLTVQEAPFLLSQSPLLRPRTQSSPIASTCPKRHRAGNPAQRTT